MVAEVHTLAGVTNTVLGTQDFTTAKCGGVVPSAAIVICTYATALEIAADDAGGSIGFFDGTRYFCCNSNQRSGQASSNTSRSPNTDCVVKMISPGSTTSVTGEATATFITDGIRLNWVDVPGAAYRIKILLFTGWDTAYVNNVDPVTQDTAYDVTAPNDELSAAFFLFADTSNDIITAHAKMSFGVASPTDNFCISVASDNNQAAGAPKTELRNDYVGYDPVAGVPAIEVSDWDTQGFTITSRAGGGNPIGYLALATTDVVKVGITTLPASGDLDVNNRRSVSSIGCKPNFIMLGSVSGAAVNTNYAKEQFSLMCSDGDDDISFTFTEENAADPTNCKSWFDNDEWSVLDDDGVGQEHTGLLYMFDNDGWTDEWSVSPASSVASFYFLVGEVVEAESEPEVYLGSGDLGSGDLGSSGLAG